MNQTNNRLKNGAIRCFGLILFIRYLTIPLNKLFDDPTCQLIEIPHKIHD